MNEAQTLSDAFRDFIDNAEAVRSAAKPLKEGVQIGVRFAGFPDEYYVTKASGRLTLVNGACAKPDWTAEITPAAVANIRALPQPDIGDLGVEIFKRMARGIVEPASDDHIKVHLTAGFFTIMRHGYLGILPLGGPKLAKWLAQNGLKNVSGIRRVFKKLRGTED